MLQGIFSTTKIIKEAYDIISLALSIAKLSGGQEYSADIEKIADFADYLEYKVIPSLDEGGMKFMPTSNTFNHSPYTTIDSADIPITNDDIYQRRLELAKAIARRGDIVSGLIEEYDFATDEEINDIVLTLMKKNAELYKRLSK